MTVVRSSVGPGSSESAGCSTRRPAGEERILESMFSWPKSAEMSPRLRRDRLLQLHGLSPMGSAGLSKEPAAGKPALVLG